jgi:hypothetical protein
MLDKTRYISFCEQFSSTGLAIKARAIGAAWMLAQMIAEPTFAFPQPSRRLLQRKEFRGGGGHFAFSSAPAGSTMPSSFLHST